MWILLWKGRGMNIRRQETGQKKRRKDSSTSSFFALCSLYTRRSVGRHPLLYVSCSLVFWIWMCWTKCQFKFIACSREYIEMYVLHRIIYTLYIVSSSLDLFLVWSCIILAIFDAKSIMYLSLLFVAFLYSTSILMFIVNNITNQPPSPRLTTTPAWLQNEVDLSSIVS